MKNTNENISEYIKRAIRTLKEYRAYILNSSECNNLNDSIEGTSNLMKVIKRPPFGYHSFI